MEYASRLSFCNISKYNFDIGVPALEVADNSMAIIPRIHDDDVLSRVIEHVRPTGCNFIPRNRTP